MSKLFYKNFAKGELKEFFKFNRIMNLVIILFITFTAIGFANDSLKYLKLKMVDPFTNWLNIVIDFGLRERISLQFDNLNNSEFIKLYNIDYIGGYYIPLLYFNKNNNIKISKIQSTGITINPNSPVCKEIMNSNNYIDGRRFKSKDRGILVTDKFLKKYEYNEVPPFIDLVCSIDNCDKKIPLPIVGVVKELPKKAEFAITPFLYSQIHNDTQPFSIKKDNKRLIYYTKTNPSFPTKNRSMLEEIMTDLEDYNPLFNSIPYEETFIKGQKFDLSFNFDSSISNSDSVLTLIDSLIVTKFSKADLFIKRIFEINFILTKDSKKYDYLMVNFKNFDKINDFSDHLSSTYEIKVEMEKVGKLENFNLIASITKILSFLLFLISAITVCMYIKQFLENHLTKIKINIGTIMAFGVNKIKFKFIYYRLLILYMVLCQSFALFLSFLIGKFGGISLILKIFKIKIESDENYFPLFNSWTYFSALLIIIFSFLTVHFTLIRILNNTPGDLIYERK